MSKLIEAVNTVKMQEGYIGPETLTMYKQAAASIKLNDKYPCIAKNIVNIFYKQASEELDNDTAANTILVAKGLTKVAGTSFEDKKDTIVKLAAVASLHNEEGVNQEENNLACYHLLCDLVS